MESERAELEQRLASLDTKAAESADARNRFQDQVAALETRLATVNQAQADAEAAAQRDLETTRQQSAGFQTAFEQLRLQTGWLRQVAGYHLGYAGSKREVEDTAEQQQKAQMLTKWLSKTLGSDFSIPDLSDAGMTFIGGRVFFVNGVPVGQIAYHDSLGRLTGFCFKRNPTGTEKSLGQSQYGNALQLIDWQDRDFQYVLIGFEDPETLEPIAEYLEASYGDET